MKRSKFTEVTCPPGTKPSREASASVPILSAGLGHRRKEAQSVNHRPLGKQGEALTAVRLAAASGRFPPADPVAAIPG